MVLDSQRENVDPILIKIAKVFKNVNPNTLTWLSLIFAMIAGGLFYFSSPTKSFIYLYGAAFFVFLNGLFDAIDGKVAKLAHKVSRRGDFLDHAVDRFADVFILGGLALSPWAKEHPYIGLLAVVGMLLTSYMGTQSQAIGNKRNYSGLLGRADRLVILMCFPIIQHIWLYFSGSGLVFRYYILEWVLVYFAVVGILTAIQRFYSTLKWFNNQEKTK
jgi:archaetidylinositol phosphate synthase